MVVPDLGHVADSIPVKLHGIDIVGRNRFARRITGSTRASLRPVKHGERGRAILFLVDREGFQLIVAVGNRREEVLHPFAIPFQRVDIGKRVRLARKRCLRMTVVLALVPSLSGLTRVKE